MAQTKQLKGIGDEIISISTRLMGQAEKQAELIGEISDLLERLNKINRSMLAANKRQIK